MTANAIFYTSATIITRLMTLAIRGFNGVRGKYSHVLQIGCNFTDLAFSWSGHDPHTIYKLYIILHAARVVNHAIKGRVLCKLFSEGGAVTVISKCRPWVLLSSPSLIILAKCGVCHLVIGCGCVCVCVRMYKLGTSFLSPSDKQPLYPPSSPTLKPPSFHNDMNAKFKLHFESFLTLSNIPPTW